MILFHIWIGDKIPEDQVGIIRHNHALLLPEDKHILLSNVKLDCCQNVPINDAIRVARINQTVARLLTEYEQMGLMLGKKTNSNYNEKLGVSDILRLSFLSMNENALYADCDCKLLKRPVLEDSKLLFGTDREKKRDIFLIGSLNGANIVNRIIDCAVNQTPNVPLLYEIINGKKIEGLGEFKSEDFKH